MKIIKQQEMPLLSRTRITAEIELTGKTPSKNDAKTKLAELLKTKPELIALRHIYQRFGSTKAKIIAHVYKNEKDLKYIESENGKEKSKKQEVKQ